MSERRSHLILVALIVAALAGVAALAIPGSPVHREATLGLDLQGGLEVVLKAQPPPGHKLLKTDLDRSVEIMRSRIDRLGVTEPEIRTQDPDQIVIELPGVHDPRRAVEILGKTAELEFYDLEVDLVSPSIDAQHFPVAFASLYDLLARVQATAEKGTPSSWYLFDKDKKLVAGPAPTREGLLNTRTAKRLFAAATAGSKSKPAAGEVPKGFKVYAVPEKTVVVHCEASTGCPGLRQATPPSSRYFYLFRYDLPKVPEMRGRDLKLSGTRQDIDPSTNSPIVTLQFTKNGQKRFHEITSQEAQRGRLYTRLYGGGQDVFQHFAIVLDREIKSTPYIDFHENPDGIAGGSGAQIQGIGSIQEAKDLAVVSSSRPSSASTSRQRWARTRSPRPSAPRSSACSSSPPSCSCSTASSAWSP